MEFSRKVRSKLYLDGNDCVKNEPGFWCRRKKRECQSGDEGPRIQEAPSLLKTGNSSLLRWRARLVWARRELVGSSLRSKMLTEQRHTLHWSLWTGLPEHKLPLGEQARCLPCARRTCGSHGSQLLESSHFPQQAVRHFRRMLPYESFKTR